MGTPVIRAAGALVWRPGPDGPWVALVHRPRQNDWTLPKGKVEPGEALVAAAVREVAEETGQSVRLGRPLPTQRYSVDGAAKSVRYWAALGDDAAFHPSREVDALEWVPARQARHRLTYPRDASVVRAFLAAPVATTPLVVLRHARALPRAAWEPRPDADRPLSRAGLRQAAELAGLLVPFGVDALHSSDAARCTATVAPLAAATGLAVLAEPLLSEPGFAGAPAAGLARVDALATQPVATVVCTHRPVLRPVLAHLLARSGKPAPRHDLPPGAFLVAHRTVGPNGSPGAILAVERHTT